MTEEKVVVVKKNIKEFYPHFVLETEGIIRKRNSANWVQVAKELLSSHIGGDCFALSIEPPLGEQREERQMQALKHQTRYYLGKKAWTLDEARKSPEHLKILKSVDTKVHAGVVQCGDAYFGLFKNDVVFNEDLEPIWIKHSEHTDDKAKSGAGMLSVMKNATAHRR